MSMVMLCQKSTQETFKYLYNILIRILEDRRIKDQYNVALATGMASLHHIFRDDAGGTELDSCIIPDNLAQSSIPRPL